MRTVRYRVNNSSGRINILSFLGAIILTIVGFLISQPFFWVVIIFGYNFHHISFLILLMIIGFIAGAPMFMFGLISLFMGNRTVGTASTTNLDIGRIRYTVETDKMERK